MAESDQFVDNKEIIIDLSSSPETPVGNMVVNAYRSGYDRVILNFNESLKNNISESISANNLIDFRLVVNDKDKIVIESTFEVKEYRFEDIFSKLLVAIDSLFNHFDDKEHESSNIIEITENQIQSYDNFCRRAVLKLDKPLKQLRLTFHTELAHAQKELYFALRDAQKLKNLSKDTKKLIQECRSIYNLLKKAYSDRDVHILGEIHKLQARLIAEQGYDLLKKGSAEEKIVIHHIINSIRNFSIATSPLIGLFTNEKGASSSSK